MDLSRNQKFASPLDDYGSVIGGHGGMTFCVYSHDTFVASGTVDTETRKKAWTECPSPFPAPLCQEGCFRNLFDHGSRNGLNIGIVDAMPVESYVVIIFGENIQKAIHGITPRD